MDEDSHQSHTRGDGLRYGSDGWGRRGGGGDVSTGHDGQRPRSVEGTLSVRGVFEVAYEIFSPPSSSASTASPTTTTTRVSVAALAAHMRGGDDDDNSTTATPPPDVALLLNPTGGCKEMWLWTGTVQALLAKGFTVVTMDCRGQAKNVCSTHSTSQ